jgi:hypothetical protein
MELSLSLPVKNANIGHGRADCVTTAGCDFDILRHPLERQADEEKLYPLVAVLLLRVF